jgi:hypothetical protein
MTDWYRHQQTMLAVRATPFRAPQRPVALPAAADAEPLPTALAAHLARAAEDLRALYEAGVRMDRSQPQTRLGLRLRLTD